MLFITNRGINEGYHTIENRSITFDLNNNAPSNSIYFCLRMEEHHYIELGSINFIEKLYKSKASHILFFIHGFNNLPEDVFTISSLLQKHFDSKYKNAIQVVPIIWPCDNDFGVIKDYWDDQKSADMSAFSLARALNKFLEWSRSSKNNVCLKRFNVLAHSMGCRVLKETLNIWQQYDIFPDVPQIFRNTFLLAGDITNKSFEIGYTGVYIAHAARNVIIYYANDDLLLKTSSIINSKNRIKGYRLGLTGPSDLSKISHNVYVVDCDDVNNIYDPPFGHSYFLNQNDDVNPGLVFNHIFSTILTGRVSLNSTDRRMILKE